VLCRVIKSDVRPSINFCFTQKDTLQNYASHMCSNTEKAQFSSVLIAWHLVAYHHCWLYLGKEMLDFSAMHYIFCKVAGPDLGPRSIKHESIHLFPPMHLHGIVKHRDNITFLYLPSYPYLLCVVVCKRNILYSLVLCKANYLTTCKNKTYYRNMKTYKHEKS
jgi:hypothetical protein